MIDREATRGIAVVIPCYHVRALAEAGVDDHGAVVAGVDVRRVVAVALDDRRHDRGQGHLVGTDKLGVTDDDRLVTTDGQAILLEGFLVNFCYWERLMMFRYCSFLQV